MAPRRRSTNPSGSRSFSVSRLKSVIARILKFHEVTGYNKSTTKTGCPRKTTRRDDRTIQRMSLVDRIETAAGISRQVCTNMGLNVSRRNVSRRLKKVGLMSCSSAKKPLISQKNRAGQLKFVNKHVLCTSSHGKRVFFNDESKLNAFGSDGKQYVRRRTGERFDPKCTKNLLKMKVAASWFSECFQVLVS